VSNRNKIYSKGRIEGQWTAVRYEVMQSAAWKHMSMGARILYIALIKNLSFQADNNGKIFLATRKAAEDIGASQRAVCFWFRELEHFGFIVQTEPGTSMRAARWRITDVGWGKLDGKSIERTKDYLKWDGELFERLPKNRKGRARKSSLRGTRVLRGVDEQKSSTTPQVEERKSSEGRPQVEERKSSDIGQPSPFCFPSGLTVLEWSRPILIDLIEMPYTDELRRVYRQEEDRALRQRAKRLGYRVNRRGAEYDLTSDSSAFGGTIDGVNDWLDVIEQKIPMQISTSCGRPLFTLNTKAAGADLIH
jgi:hypothetical protein